MPAASAFGAQTDDLSPTVVRTGKICPCLGTLRTAARCSVPLPPPPPLSSPQDVRMYYAYSMHVNSVVKVRSAVERF